MKTAIFLAWILAAAFLVSPAHALTCNTVLTANTTLTADLVCNNTWGLQIDADNVTLDLNGHTISCISSTGYLGSCQPTPTQAPGAVAGVATKTLPSGFHRGVAIRGPGVIAGFAIGINMEGSGMVVEGVTVTGPSVPKSVEFDNFRGEAVGILVTSHCNFTAVGAGGGVTLLFNEIFNQGEGVDLTGSCALIAGNFIHDNGDLYGGLGVLVQGVPGFGGQGSQNNAIYENNIVRNGVNYPQTNTPLLPDGGVVLSLGPADTNNRVFANNVSGNCGYGILVQDAVNNALVTANVVLNNSTSSYGGQCYTVPVGTYFDVAESNAQTPWNAGSTANTCKTKGPGIPSGTCM